MKGMKKVLRRFGGWNLLDRIPKPEEDDRVKRGSLVRESLDARIKAIEIDLDVQSRKRMARGNR